MALLFFVFFLQAQVGSRSFLLPSCVKLLLSFRGDDGAFIAWPGLANRILAFSNTHTTFAAKAQFMGKESLRRQPAKANTPPASSFLFCYAASPRKSCLKQDIIKCNQTVALAKHWLFDFGFLWKPSSSLFYVIFRKWMSSAASKVSILLACVWFLVKLKMSALELGASWQLRFGRQRFSKMNF